MKFTFGFLLLISVSVCFAQIKSEDPLPIEDPSLLVGTECHENSHCPGGNVHCDISIHRCRCDFLHAPGLTDDGVFCVNGCHQNHQCVERFGNDTYCSVEGKCECHPGFHIKNNKCVTDARTLGQTCKDSVNSCGYGAGCDEINNRCECKVGHTKMNDYACHEINCLTDSQCNYAHSDSSCFARQENIDSRRCICQGRYIQEGVRCVSRGGDLGEKCHGTAGPNRDGCGKNAICLWDHCQCIFGHIPKRGDPIDCELNECSGDYDCRMQDLNSVCDRVVKKCICKEGHEVDPRSQQCVKIPDLMDVIKILLGRKAAGN